MFDLLPSRSGFIHICGHRGHVMDGHENTRPAFKRAAELGASLCEIDLRMTRDNRLVVFHDDILDDSSDGRGLISQLDYADLGNVRTRARNGMVIEGQPIEPFEAILDCCRDLGLGLIVEIKDRIEDTAYLEQVARLIREARMLERVLISCFDYVVLRDMKRVAPEIHTLGISHHRFVDPAATAHSAGMDVMNTDYPWFAADLAESLHEAHIGVSHFVPKPDFFALRRSYGVNYLKQLDAHLSAGHIDMLICDDVEWAVEFVTARGLNVTRLGQS